MSPLFIHRNVVAISPVLNTNWRDPSTLTRFPPWYDLRNFQNERLVYDTHNDRFSWFTRIKDRNSVATRSRLDSDEGKCIYRESSILFITQWTNNSAEIKRRPAGYKNTKIMTPSVHMEWTLHACSHNSVLRIFSCFIVIKVMRVETESGMSHTVEIDANSAILKKKLV